MSREEPQQVIDLGAIEAHLTHLLTDMKTLMAYARSVAGRLESQLNTCEQHSMELAAYKDAFKDLRELTDHVSGGTFWRRRMDEITDALGIEVIK